MRFVRTIQLIKSAARIGWELVSRPLKNRPLQAVIGSGWVEPHSCAPGHRTHSLAHTRRLFNVHSVTRPATVDIPYPLLSTGSLVFVI